jgi:hypothetical protein
MKKKESGGQKNEYSREIYEAYEGNIKKQSVWICTICAGEPCVMIGKPPVDCLDDFKHPATKEEIKMVMDMLRKQIKNVK